MPIYKVIEDAYFKGSEEFQDDFIKKARIMKMKLNVYHSR